MPARSRIIADLRASIEGIEKRPAPVLPADTAPGGARAEDVPQIGPGTLSEIFADAPRDAGPAFGFALHQAQGLIAPERPAVLFLQMRGEAQETGLPYGPGLFGFGFDPDALAVVRTDTIAELLWAMEEAAGCGSVAAVIGDSVRTHKQLDFTASRRLSLRAENFGVALMLMRTGTEREASAATFRFHAAAAQSAEAAFDTRAPGASRIRIVLEKGARRLGTQSTGQDAYGRNFWDLRWSENGLVMDKAFPGETGSPVRERDLAKSSGPGGHFPSRPDGRPALSGADAAGLGDRLSQTA